MIQLSDYLKQFKNIVWFPNARPEDIFLALKKLSKYYLSEHNIPIYETPDCFIFTEEQMNVFEFLAILGQSRLKVPCSESLLAPYFGCAIEAIDIYFDTIDTCNDFFFGTKIIFIHTRHEDFINFYLNVKKPTIKYIVNDRYSDSVNDDLNGHYLCGLFKKLHTKYYVLDSNEILADPTGERIYLGERCETIPVLSDALINFSSDLYDNWIGRGEIKLFKIASFNHVLGFFR